MRTGRERRPWFVAWAGTARPLLLVAGALLQVLLVTAPANARADDEGSPWIEIRIGTFDTELDRGRIRSGPRSGLVYESGDGATRFHLGGVGILDLYRYDSRNSRSNGPAIGQAVVRFDGRVASYWSYRVGVDLHGVDSEYGLDEAWLAISPGDDLRVRVGLFEIPLGFELGFARDDLPFDGYGYSSYVTGRTDWGVGFDGQVGQGLLGWQLAAVVGEGYDLHGTSRDSPQLSARLFSYPLRTLDIEARFLGARIPVEGLFAGFSASWSPSYRSAFEISTPMRNKIFRVDPFRADEARFFHVTAGWDAGPVRLAYEAVLGEVFEQWFGSGSGFQGVDTPGGDVDLDQVGTWEASVSWTVTGQPYDSRPFDLRETSGRTPGFPSATAHEDAPGPRHAVEVFFRYENADIDRGFFDSGLADFETSSQEFRTASVGAHWHPNPNLRLTGAVARTIADQGPATFGGHDRDTSFLLEVRYRF